MPGSAPRAATLATLLAACGPPPVPADDAPDALSALQGLYASTLTAAAKGRKPGRSFGDEVVPCEDGGTATVTLVYTVVDEVPTGSDGDLLLEACTVRSLTVSGTLQDAVDFDANTEHLQADVVFTGAIEGSCVVDVTVDDGATTGTVCGHDASSFDGGTSAD